MISKAATSSRETGARQSRGASPSEVLPPSRSNIDINAFELDGEEYVVVSRPIEAVPHQLSEAELAVGKLIALGHTNERIAKLRGTTTRTVANQVASLLRKLGAPSRHHVGPKIGLR